MQQGFVVLHQRIVGDIAEEQSLFLISIARSPLGRLGQRRGVVDRRNPTPDRCKLDSKGVELAGIGLAIASCKLQLPTLPTVHSVDPFPFGSRWSTVTLPTAVPGDGIRSHDRIHRCDRCDCVVDHLDRLFQRRLGQLLDLVGGGRIKIPFKTRRVLAPSGNLLDIQLHFFLPLPVHRKQEQQKEHRNGQGEHDRDTDEQARNLLDLVGPHRGLVDTQHPAGTGSVG